MDRQKGNFNRLLVKYRGCSLNNGYMHDSGSFVRYIHVWQLYRPAKQQPIRQFNNINKHYKYIEHNNTNYMHKNGQNHGRQWHNSQVGH